MIFDLIRDLELILSDITFTGINNIDYNVIDKISSISKQFEKIGMNHLKDLLMASRGTNYLSKHNNKLD